MGRPPRPDPRYPPPGTWVQIGKNPGASVMTARGPVRIPHNRQDGRRPGTGRRIGAGLLTAGKLALPLVPGGGAISTGLGLYEAFRGAQPKKGAPVTGKPKKRRLRAILGKNMPSHRMITRLRRFAKRWRKDAATIMKLTGGHPGGGRIPKGYRGYGRRKKRSPKR